MTEQFVNKRKNMKPRSWFEAIYEQLKNDKTYIILSNPKSICQDVKISSFSTGWGGQGTFLEIKAVLKNQSSIVKAKMCN